MVYTQELSIAVVQKAKDSMCRVHATLYVFENTQEDKTPAGRGREDLCERPNTISRACKVVPRC